MLAYLVIFNVLTGTTATAVCGNIVLHRDNELVAMSGPTRLFTTRVLLHELVANKMLVAKRVDRVGILAYARSRSQRCRCLL